MGSPFKNLRSTPGGTNDQTAKEKIPLVPGKDDPRINQEPADTVPDHAPIPAWPKEHAVDQKPFKNMSKK